MSDKLKPCPFCGKKHTAEIESCVELEDCENFISCNDYPYKTVVCNVNKGGCGACGGYYPTKSEAIEAWNRRAGEQE